MEKLREIAEAHYNASSQKVQTLARDLFRLMDTDKDGKVDMTEFLTFMRELGYSHTRGFLFFKELDQDGNGTLDFSEVMTLYYIIKSGRPFCDNCESFIPDIFFSCVECLKNPEKSFNLCLNCYRSAKCKHDHDGRVQFLDNYTLLEAKRDSILAEGTSPNSNQTSTATSTGNVYVSATNATSNYTDVAHPPTQGPNYLNAIVPATSATTSTTPSTRNVYVRNTNPTYNTYGAHPPTQDPNYSNAIVPATSATTSTTTSTGNVYVRNTNPTYNTYVAHPPTQDPNYSNAIVPATSAKDKLSIALRAFEMAVGIGTISSTLCTIL